MAVSVVDVAVVAVVAVVLISSLNVGLEQAGGTSTLQAPHSAELLSKFRNSLSVAEI